MIKRQSLIDRFLRYVKIDTQSQEDTGVQPSTRKQLELAEVLAAELEEMGARVDFDREHCYVYAVVPASGAGSGKASGTGADDALEAAPETAPALGFVAHLDTSPAASGAGVKPRIIENYQGGDAILKTDEFPELLNHFGEDLIATDGTTLLGADDKAGVAEIMEMAAHYLAHPELPHREIRIAFTPDEEIGAGTDNFDPARFGAGEAYTVDGGKLGELEYECFNAAAARVDIRGRSVHPGDAKNRMINACRVAMEFAALLPAAETPEHTEGYEGFYHLDEMGGSVDGAWLKYIIRDHDSLIFEARKTYMQRAAEYLGAKYGEGVVTLTMRDQYRNMAEPMREHMELIERAKAVFAGLGVTPRVKPIRGGTDGAALSFMGIPCPNLSTGGYNYHGRFEYASVQEMETMVEVLIRLAAG